ncbi:MAG: UvrD-helicase domain-containing protein [Steroidobacteraceae bacterium]
MSEALWRADLAARAGALDPARSILLQAPAGSGKTAVLTQRFLRLLCMVDEPQAILAITFTRKAAAEMRGRVLRALHGQIPDDDPCAPQLRQLAAEALRHAATRDWKLLQAPGALRIQTIDSFDYWLASQLPVAARAGGTLTVTEAAGELYRRAARRTLVDGEADAQLADDIELLFERFDNNWNLLERLLAQMLRQRSHWLRYVVADEPRALCERINASLAAIIGTRLAAAHRLMPRALAAHAAALPGVGMLGSDPQHLPAWQRLAGLALTDAGWRKILSARHLGPGYEEPAARAALRGCVDLLTGIPGLETALRDVLPLPPPLLSATEAGAIAALSRVLARAAAELHLEFAAGGRVDYTYIAGAAREALSAASEPTDLALRTGMSLRHVLVDEFQDTSLAQFQLLEKLTAGWEPGDGRTLFVVGDPMQSIYRFRDAEVGLFIAARDHGIGQVQLTPLRLTRNFRAAPALVSWTNEVFARVLAPADDLRAGAVSFAASVAARAPPTAAAGARLQIFPGDSRAEAQSVASEIVRLKSAAPDAEVAVLVAVRAHASGIVSALRARGIEPLGVDLVPLADRPIVRDLVQLGCALHDLGDRSAWLAVLRAPWCGARLATLTALSGPKEPQLIWEALHDSAKLAQCLAGDRERLLRVREVLAEALGRRDAETPADWLETTWTRLGGPDAYERQDLEDARAFFSALAARCAALEWRSPADFPALLADLYSAARVAQHSPVQIMTIYRAKGLEFDHVFVPALERVPDSGDAALLEWIDLPRGGEESDLLMVVAPATDDKRARREPLSALIRSLQKTRAAHEHARLMYVAATRARQTLHLSAAPQPRKDGTITPDRRSLLGCVWPALRAAFQVNAAPAEAPRKAASLLLRRLAQDWTPPELPPAPRLMHLPLARAALEPYEFSWVGETQRHIGTIVHAWLARAADSQLLPSPTEIAAQRAALEGELRRQGVPAEERPAAAAIIATALQRTCADAQGRWILAPHRQARSELPLTGLSEGRLRSVVIDRSFVDENGTRWVIDYKTSRHEGGGLEEFLAQELQRYEPQLRTYAALARALGPEPVRAALYFPLLGALRELTASR